MSMGGIKTRLDKVVAHTSPRSTDPNDWEPLWVESDECHLEWVSRRCETFASRTFKGLGREARQSMIKLARCCSLWHDLGKFSCEFQNYLKQQGSDCHTGEVTGRVDHSTAGAQYAMQSGLREPFNAMVAYVTACHHSGLLDGQKEIGSSLLSRLKKADIPKWREHAPESILRSPEIDVAALVQAIAGNQRDIKEIAFRLAFATRMLFSCLTDADFLATEAFMNPEQARQRPDATTDFKALADHLKQYIENRFQGAEGVVANASAEGVVANARAEVLAACCRKAEGRPGLYQLTVPTGGGKTLSSLAFALNHCAVNQLERVIFAIPFTSIIEQNADVFRSVFRTYPADLDTLILEHHSNFDPDKETTRSRLVSENWDAPIVVTTNVQLFESLFAKAPSQCRKLHNIANSVIILDEAQTLPVTLLRPCLKALQLLVEQYGCSVVLCTATQPAIEHRPDFPIGLPSAIPIVDDAPGLYQKLKRVIVRHVGTLNCSDLAQKILDTDQALAIVNTRAHAAKLYETLKSQNQSGEGCFHLSAAMTPEHRSQKLSEIRNRLNNGEPCWVVATQLIEAGVDVDFPVVWRAMAGLDSVAQAAGRCNREGKLTEAYTYVFEPAEEEFRRLFGTLRTGADAALHVLKSGQYDELLSLDAIEHYFRIHYWQRKDDWDQEKICDKFMLSNQVPYLDAKFTTVAEKFRFIDQSQRSVIVGWDQDSQALLKELRKCHDLDWYPGRSLVRKLQRQSVAISQNAWQHAFASGKIEILCDYYAVLSDPALYYDPNLGLRLGAEPIYDINMLIID